MEELTLKTKLPTFEEIERYNNKDQYKGLELLFHLAEDLFLRISVQNERCIFPMSTKDNIIYLSLCNRVHFPIYSVSYKYCKEGYEVGLQNIFTAATHLQDGLIKLKNVLLDGGIQQ